MPIDMAAVRMPELTPLVRLDLSPLWRKRSMLGLVKGGRADALLDFIMSRLLKWSVTDVMQPAPPYFSPMLVSSKLPSLEVSAWAEVFWLCASTECVPNNESSCIAVLTGSILDVVHWESSIDVFLADCYFIFSASILDSCIFSSSFLIYPSCLWARTSSRTTVLFRLCIDSFYM